MTDLKAPQTGKMGVEVFPAIVDVPYAPYRYDDPVDLIEVARSLYRERYLIVLIVAALTVAAVGMSYTVTPIYRAETLLAPAVHDKNEGASTLIGQLGDIASLVGSQVINPKDRTAESIATLRSRSLGMDFIREHNLKPKLFPVEWDAERQAWRQPDKTPTDLQAYGTFDARVRIVNVDRRNGLVSLLVEWTEPRLAAEWANRLVTEVNRRRQTEAIQEAQQSVKYLQQQLGRNSPIEVQQSIYRLIESQLKTIALARAREEYAFRVIDPAVVPERPIRPQRLTIAGGGFVVGVFIALAVVFVRRVLARQAATLKSPG